MSTTFIWTTDQRINTKQRKKIQNAITSIDNTVTLVCVNIPGNHIHGWLERPNDGTNDNNYQVEKNRRCIAEAERILAG